MRVPDPGAEPHPADPPGQDQPARESDIRLQAQRHRPPCSLRWRLRPARSPTAVMTATARPSSWISQARRQDLLAAPIARRAGQLPDPQHDDINRWLAKNPRNTLHFTPTSGSWAEPRRGVLQNHYPPSDPPRVVQQRQTTHHRDPRVHRRLQRPLPPVRLDQDRRRHRVRRYPSTNFRRATLVGGPPRARPAAWAQEKSSADSLSSAAFGSRGAIRAT